MVYPVEQGKVEEEMERIKEKRKGYSKKILAAVAIGAVIAGAVGGMILYNDMKLSTGTETSTPQYNPDTPVVVATPTPEPTPTPLPPHFVHKGKIIYYSDEYPAPGTPKSPEDVSEYVTTALEIGYNAVQEEDEWDPFHPTDGYIIANKWMNRAIHAVAVNDFEEEYVIAHHMARDKYLYGDCYDENKNVQHLKELYAECVAEGGGV